MWGSDPCFSSLPAEGRSSPINTPVFPPSSFILPSVAWFYIFFSTGQVLLLALSWCSACTSVSEGVFLMYLWTETYSVSTYSSAILPSLALLVEISSSAILLYLTCSVSTNLGETISYYGHKEVFLCESILMQAAYAQCLWWEGWT